jgi:hypothetical protein
MEQAMVTSNRLLKNLKISLLQQSVSIHRNRNSEKLKDYTFTLHMIIVNIFGLENMSVEQSPG